jgi:hypothetical protein
MKTFLLCMILATGSQVEASRDGPLVSFERVSSLVWSSVELGTDLLKFGSTKLQESLSGEPRKIYDKFADNADKYKGMVVEWYSESAVVSSVDDNLVKPVMSVLKGRYDAFNKLNHVYLDGIVDEFENRFPNSAGLFGSDLIDRTLVVVWLYMCVRCVMNTMCRGCCKRPLDK